MKWGNAHYSLRVFEIREDYPKIHSVQCQLIFTGFPFLTGLLKVSAMVHGTDQNTLNIYIWTFSLFV